MSDRYSRREFLARAVKYSSLPLLAMMFGCDISTGSKNPVGKTAIVYASRYGATRDTAAWIRQGMNQNIDLLDIEHITCSDTLDSYDSFIVGSGIWISGVHPKILEFLQAGRKKLADRLLATFIVCGTEGRSGMERELIDSYLSRLHSPLKEVPPLSKVLGGRLVVEKLSEQDRKALEIFYTTYLNSQLHSWDRTDPLKAELLGKDIMHLHGNTFNAVS